MSMKRRLGGSERDILVVQSNLAVTCEMLGRSEQALHAKREVYSGMVRLIGGEHESTLLAASNYANSLICLRRFEEAKSLSRKTIAVARRALGEGHRITLKMQWFYSESIYKDDCATLDDLHEAVGTLEDTARISRRLLGSAHPLAMAIEGSLRDARAALHARETPPSGSTQNDQQGIVHHDKADFPPSTDNAWFDAPPHDDSRGDY